MAAAVQSTKDLFLRNGYANSLADISSETFSALKNKIGFKGELQIGDKHYTVSISEAWSGIDQSRRGVNVEIAPRGETDFYGKSQVYAAQYDPQGRCYGDSIRGRVTPREIVDALSKETISPDVDLRKASFPTLMGVTSLSYDVFREVSETARGAGKAKGRMAVFGATGSLAFCGALFFCFSTVYAGATSEGVKLLAVRCSQLTILGALFTVGWIVKAGRYYFRMRNREIWQQRQYAENLGARGEI